MSFLASVIEHLWASTLFLALVLATVFALRARLTASARFALVLIGILKFALPAPLVTGWAGRLTGPSTSRITELSQQAGSVFRVELAPTQSSAPWPELLAGLWLAVAAIILARHALTRHRLVRLVLQTAAPATNREIAALRRARVRTGVRRSVDVVRSGVAEAPAVLRIIRPMVVLPAAGCDELSDAELEALLCHECAHVRRHDNLIARIESFICALFWFHPLIWIAQRITVIERERACDEAVADSADERETYLAALAKFCHASVVPRLPGVSCMATARLKERMTHVENYQTLKEHALSAKRIGMIGVTALLAYTAFVGITGTGQALAGGTKDDQAPYAIKISAIQKGDVVDLDGRVIDNATQAVIASPVMRFKAGEAASLSVTLEDTQIKFNVLGGDPAQVPVEVTVYRTGRQPFVRTMKISPAQNRETPQKYTGAPITLHLKDADVRDVLRTFGDLTGLKMVLDDSVRGSVSVAWTDVPWDQALDEILRDNGLTMRVEPGTMYVTKK